MLDDSRASESESEPPSRTRLVLALAGPVNFLAFLLCSYALGGEALNGHLRGGTFFLANHGEYTQVSELTYWFSYLHGVSVFVLVVPSAIAIRSLERQGDAIWQTVEKPLGALIVAVAIAAVLAWSLEFPPSIVIPILLGIAGVAIAVGAVFMRRARTQ